MMEKLVRPVAFRTLGSGSSLSASRLTWELRFLQWVMPVLSKKWFLKNHYHYQKKRFHLFGLVLKSRNKLRGCFKIDALIHNFCAIELPIPQFCYILQHLLAFFAFNVAKLSVSIHPPLSLKCLTAAQMGFQAYLLLAVSFCFCLASDGFTGVYCRAPILMAL